MSRAQQALAEVLLRDPRWSTTVVLHRRGWHQSTLNSGRLQIRLKPLAERDARAARTCAPEAARCEVAGIGCTCSRCRI
jgi:multidrug efflux pump